MTALFHNRWFYIITTLLIIGGVIALIVNVQQNNRPAPVTTTVETGTVQQIVSVSGIAEAEQTAELAFPVTGIVADVQVSVGDEVALGDTLITLEADALMADRQDAAANLARAVADRDELLAGPTGSAREVTAETLTRAEESLATTRENEARKIENAYRTLLSSDLTARSEDPDEEAVAPTVSGTYTCGEEGTYVVDVFSSNAESGYSYRLSGIETGTYVASVDQPSRLGECGLRLLFDTDSSYSRTTWYIEIPNTDSSTYVTNRNAYALTVTQAESAIALAEQEVALARANATNQNAPARDEAIRRANATIAQAQARLARIDATIGDRVLTAPFSGTVTELDVLPGETVGTTPVVTLLASSEFEVTARIPEIDIGKLEIGQPVRMIFDARSDEVLTGEVSFISLKSTEIDGVAYYEAVVELDEVPRWIRSGLNADIDIITTEVKNVLRIPSRFLIRDGDSYQVIRQTGAVTATTSVDLLLDGNDGFVAITGVTDGDVLVAP